MIFSLAKQAWKVSNCWAPAVLEVIRIPLVVLGVRVRDGGMCHQRLNLRPTICKTKASALLSYNSGPIFIFYILHEIMEIRTEMFQIRKNCLLNPHFYCDVKYSQSNSLRPNTLYK